jgi:hypothetical protein
VQFLRCFEAIIVASFPVVKREEKAEAKVA